MGVDFDEEAEASFEEEEAEAYFTGPGPSHSVAVQKTVRDNNTRSSSASTSKPASNVVYVSNHNTAAKPSAAVPAKTTKPK